VRPWPLWKGSLPSREPEARDARGVRCTVGFELFAKQAREARINSEFPTYGLGIFKKARAAGYGEEEVAAVIKVLR
jgi:hypothetical protein